MCPSHPVQCAGTGQVGADGKGMKGLAEPFRSMKRGNDLLAYLSHTQSGDFVLSLRGTWSATGSSAGLGSLRLQTSGLVGGS